MVYVILAFVFFIFGTILFIASRILLNSKNQFKKNAFITTGTYVSRKLCSDGYMSEIYVDVVDRDGNKRELLSQSFRPTAETLSPGMQIKVALAEKKTFGIGTYELIIVDERYAKISDNISHIVLLVLSILFYIFALSMLAISFIR